MKETLPILFLTILFSLAAFSAEEIKLDENFQAFMIDHAYEGCPTNSECTKELGIKRKSWSDLLQKHSSLSDLKALTQKYGHPFKVWFEPKKVDNSKLISWNSPCDIHNKEEQIIRTGEYFLKSHLKTSEAILFHKVYFEKGNEVIEYIIPRDESPLYKDGNDLIFLLEEKGRFYGLKVTAQNDFSLIKSPATKVFSETVSCPKKLSDYFKKNASKELYSFFNCKALWNVKTKKLETFIVGKACS